MSRYVDIDQIIADIYGKWGCDPAYIANDTPTGVEARRDAKFIELLRSEPSIDIVRCEKCRFYDSVRMSGGYLPFCKKLRILGDFNYHGFCSFGERRKPNE